MKGLLIIIDVVIFILLFYFLLPCEVEKILFLGLMFKIEILLNLYVSKSPESNNNIFRGWSLVVYYQYNSKTNNCRDTKISIIDLYHMEVQFGLFIIKSFL